MHGTSGSSVFICKVTICFYIFAGPGQPGSRTELPARRYGLLLSRFDAARATSSNLF